MKKIFLQIGAVIILLGGGYSVGWALPFQQIDPQINNQVQFQAQPQAQIPDFHFNPNGANNPVDNKAKVMTKIDSLIDVIEKASVRVEKVKYLSEQEEKDILETIKDVQKKAEKIKSDVEHTQNFNQVKREHFMLKIGALFTSLRTEIPKTIIEKQLEHGQQALTKLGVVTDKIEIYVSVAKKQNLNVNVAESRLTKAKVKLTDALDYFEDVKKSLDKIQSGMDLNTAKGHFKEANKEFRLAYQEIKEAKNLLKESIIELQKIAKD